MKNIIKSVLIVIVMLFGSTLFASDKKANPIHGAEVWAQTCMRCHNVRPPEDYNKHAWAYSINHMRVRAGLTGQEARDVLAFIIMSKTQEDAK